MSAGLAQESAVQATPASMVARMTLILDAFEDPGDRLTLERISRHTGLPRSTAHRIIEQLLELEWLAHSPAGYRLGARPLRLGGGQRLHDELRSAAAPQLQDLVLRTGLVAHLGVLKGPDVLYLDKVGGRRAVGVPSRVGTLVPAHMTAIGKAVLAWLAPELVDELFTDGMERRTSHTIGDLNALHSELLRIRARGGLAFEQGECFARISCVGAAIRGPEGPLGAVSLVGEPGTPLDRVAPLLVNAAREISLELFDGLQAASWR